MVFIRAPLVFVAAKSAQKTAEQGECDSEERQEHACEEEAPNDSRDAENQKNRNNEREWKVYQIGRWAIGEPLNAIGRVAEWDCGRAWGCS